jgi:hypothetical protein
MPPLETWDRFPDRLRRHLLERLRDRAITVEDLDRLRQWVQSEPSVPTGPWYKDFGSFKLCGEGPLPKTFLRPGQAVRGRRL